MIPRLGLINVTVNCPIDYFDDGDDGGTEKLITWYKN